MNIYIYTRKLTRYLDGINNFENRLYCYYTRMRVYSGAGPLTSIRSKTENLFYTESLQKKNNNKINKYFIKRSTIVINLIIRLIFIHFGSMGNFFLFLINHTLR